MSLEPLPPDRVEVRGLKVDAVCGVGEQERAAPQPLEVDLDLYLSLDAAAAGDDLSRTADYGQAVEAAVSALRAAPRALLETLAAEVARAVLADEKVEAVTVTLHKLAPPLSRQLQSAGVRLTRRRA